MLSPTSSASTFFGNTTQQALYVQHMQQIFVVRDGSAIQNPTDPTVLSAIQRELLVISPKFSSMQSINDIRNPALFSDTDMARMILLAIMGNFHSQTLQDVDLYNDVQVRYDPLLQHFITRQNMRDTEIVVFQSLLVICVIGLFIVFMMDKDKAKPQQVGIKIENVESVKNKINLPEWTRVRFRDGFGGV